MKEPEQQKCEKLVGTIPKDLPETNFDYNARVEPKVHLMLYLGWSEKDADMFIKKYKLT